MRCHDPSLTQRSTDDAVVSLVVSDVRQINAYQHDSKGRLRQTYKVDVIYAPLEENISHSQIEPTPEYSSRGPFRKVLEQLARLAQNRIDQHGWEIEPLEIRGS